VYFLEFNCFFSSLAAEILPAQLQATEQVPPKSLLHEKLFEKNASMARNFSNWVDEHYNQVNFDAKLI
jgi:hypothetical protein